jgi:hypothetical protein
MLCGDNYSKRNRVVAIAAGVAASVVILGWVSGAKAALITPGQTITPVPQFLPNPPGLPQGTVVAHENEPFTGTVTIGTATATITGNLYSEVVNVGTTLAPLYDFVYQVTNTGTGNDDEISRLSLASFSGVTTDVTDSSVSVQTSLTASVVPTSVADPDASGDVIAWNFDPADIGQGQTTYSLIIATDANSFVQGDGSLTDDAIANAPIEAPAFEMMVNVPEPTSVAVVGIVGGLLISRRKRRA